ncbi:hypothetical protein Vi05172_g7147 [Venturia inaequalis]|nr:hypothetical protein Vi05172_g7147 [Venturia inaequalis]
MSQFEALEISDIDLKLREFTRRSFDIWRSSKPRPRPMQKIPHTYI